MIIAAAPPGVASFTDDSSPDTRRTGGTKVSIHAQVLREESLDWYFRLISFYPDIPGELKSARILGTLSNNLPVTQTADGFSIKVPARAPDPIASVIALDTGSAR